MLLASRFLMGANVVVLSLMVILAVALVRSRTYLSAVVTLAIFSVLSSLEYMILGAPAVAITEAAINACLSTVLLLCAGNKVNFAFEGRHQRYSPWLSAPALLLWSALVIFASKFPGFGEMTNPVITQGRIYTMKTAEAMGFPNVVTAILASFRGYDTLLETVVIFAAAVAVLNIMRGDSETT
jgi:multicomponent Na+:H+ antiporter subunit B